MIIAEAGIDHRGRLSRAYRYVETAKRCGADAVKFQIFVSRETLFCPMEGDENRWAYWNESIMPEEKWHQVRQRAKRIGIKFGASVFQHGAVDLLKRLNPDFVKVASRAAHTFPYEKVQGLFVIGSNTIEALHTMECKRMYPTPLEMARWGMTKHGLSDHSGTPWPAIDALSRGAECIEVHLKLDNNGVDAESSVTPDELKLICQARDAFRQMRAA